jgi:phosphoribosyl-ATP pyrophosphohydrolase
MDEGRGGPGEGRGVRHASGRGGSKPITKHQPHYHRRRRCRHRHHRRHAHAPHSFPQVLLRRKLLEEASELAEASEPDHVAAEAADLLYFALTRCVAAGVGLREIGEHLEHRSTKVTRRAGHAKPAEQRRQWGDTS